MMRNDFQIRILQVCVVVKDVDAAVGNFEELLGIGPFAVYTVDSKDMPGVTYRGLPGDYRVKVAMTKVGGGVIELIENQRGANIYTEFLAKHGEGIHHIGLITDDFEPIFKNFCDRGLQPSLDGPIVGKTMGRFTYFDTEPRVGGILELLDVPGDVLQKWGFGSAAPVQETRS
jgi:methylmalonyl-CoA/ethylmalonyl-CoA epimerase